MSKEHGTMLDMINELRNVHHKEDYNDLKARIAQFKAKYGVLLKRNVMKSCITSLISCVGCRQEDLTEEENTDQKHFFFENASDKFPLFQWI